MDYIDLLRRIPRPTAEQYAAFAEHLCSAHSWYKHLPLLPGGQFVVFLALNTGARPKAASLTSNGSFILLEPHEEQEYSEKSPRLHYSWTTTREYRERFGYLDYMWRDDVSGPWDRDDSEPMELPLAIRKDCGITLYPYVSHEFNAEESFMSSIHKDAWAELESGFPHPARIALLEWRQTARDCDFAWYELTSTEQDRIVGCQISDSFLKPEEISLGVKAYLELDTRRNDLYFPLQRGEADKIHHALAMLDNLLVEVSC